MAPAGKKDGGGGRDTGQRHQPVVPLIDKAAADMLLAKFADPKLNRPKYESPFPSYMTKKVVREKLYRKLQRHPELLDEAREAAAVDIQRIWRGWWTRWCLRCERVAVYSTMGRYSAMSRYADSMVGLRDVETPAPPCCDLKLYLAFAETYLRGHGVAMPLEADGSINDTTLVAHWREVKVPFENFAACLIQKTWKGFFSRRIFQHNKRVYELKGALEERLKRELTANEAAVKIQRAWMSYMDRHVFFYYRDLINFHERGDPAYMLRCINPREARLFDSAMGVFVRFRLGGTCYPPRVYYKVFTHRPITDLGALAPRDYTLNDNRQPIALEANSQPALRGGPLVAATAALGGAAMNGGGGGGKGVVKLPPIRKMGGSASGGGGGGDGDGEATGGKAPSGGVLHRGPVAAGRTTTAAATAAAMASSGCVVRPNVAALDVSRGAYTDENTGFYQSAANLQQGWYMRVENNGWRLVSDRSLATLSEYTDAVTFYTHRKVEPYHHSRLVRQTDKVKKKKARAVAWKMAMYKKGKEEERGGAEQEDEEDEEDEDAEELMRWSKALDFDAYSNHWGMLATTGHSDDKVTFYANEAAADLTEAEWTLLVSQNARYREKPTSAGRSQRAKSGNGARSVRLEEMYLTGNPAAHGGREASHGGSGIGGGIGGIAEPHRMVPASALVGKPDVPPLTLESVEGQRLLTGMARPFSGSTTRSLQMQ